MGGGWGFVCLWVGGEGGGGGGGRGGRGGTQFNDVRDAWKDSF